MLKGIVEIDETFIGGKNYNRHKNKKIPHSQGRSSKDKTIVLGMKERSGNVIFQKVPNTQLSTLLPIIRTNVDKGSDICSDE